MPKMKLTESQQKTRTFQATVSKQLTLLKMGREQQTKFMCMSRSTLWSKLQTPNDLRVGELIHLYTILEFSEEDKHILF